MHFQWERLNTTVTRPVERLWRFMAQGTHIGGRYTGKVEKFIYNFMFLAVNWQRNFSVPGISNW